MLQWQHEIQIVAASPCLRPGEGAIGRLNWQPPYTCFLLHECCTDTPATVQHEIQSGRFSGFLAPAGRTSVACCTRPAATLQHPAARYVDSRQAGLSRLLGARR